MNELVWLPLPSAMRNSFILTGSTFRTFWAAVHWLLPASQLALAERSALMSFLPDVTENVTATLWPGSTGNPILRTLPLPFATTLFQPLGVTRLISRSLMVWPDVLVKTAVTFWVVLGANVCSRLGLSTLLGALMLSIDTSYPAATTLAWIAWLVSRVGNVPGAVMAPS